MDVAVGAVLGCWWVVYLDLASCPAVPVSWTVLCAWRKCEFLFRVTELFPMSHLSKMGGTQLTEFLMLFVHII